MHIVFDLSACYEWEHADPPATESERHAHERAFIGKPSVDGKWLRKVVHVRETHTTVGIPETQINALAEYWKGRGVTKTRAQMVAAYLEEVVMGHHAHPEHYKRIHVHDEPEVENFLNRYFACDGGAP